MKLRLTIHIPNWLDKICTTPVLVYRRIRYGYPFRKIRLTEGNCTIVDPDVFYRLDQFYWLTCGKVDFPYAARVIRSETGQLNTILMHRQILNAPPGLFVDHRDGKTLDNRTENLRLSTPSQNSCNSRRDKSKTYSKYRGVSFSKRKQKWFAAIRINGKKTWLGYFTSETAAAKAYDVAAKKYHGEFARLNFG